MTSTSRIFIFTELTVVCACGKELRYSWDPSRTQVTILQLCPVCAEEVRQSERRKANG